MYRVFKRSAVQKTKKVVSRLTLQSVNVIINYSRAALEDDYGIY